MAYYIRPYLTGVIVLLSRPSRVLQRPYQGLIIEKIDSSGNDGPRHSIAKKTPVLHETRKTSG